MSRVSRFRMNRRPVLLVSFLAFLVAGTVSISWLGLPTDVTVETCQADDLAPGPMDRHIVNAVTKLLKREHLLRRPLDDEASKRCLNLFLEALDPWKMYFLQSDIDSFKKHETELDDMLLDRDVSFAFDVYEVFLKRVDERLKTIESLLSETPDFTKDEELLIDRDVAEWPKTAEEAAEKWRKRIKYDLLILKTEDEELTGEAAVDKLRRRYESFAKRMHQTDNDELLEMFLTAMTNSFDPHTSYMSADTLKNFEIAMSLELEGIGASLKSEDGVTVIHKIIRGGAADKDGRLKPKDKIIAVAQGKDGEFEDIVDMKLQDVVGQIRGKRGTTVRLKVVSVDDPKPKVIDIVRAKIELKDSEAKGEVFEAGLKPDRTPYRIGVIDLPSFYMDMAGARRGQSDYKSTTRDVREILDGFREKGVDAVILDLRANGGGSLTEAINLTGLFIDEGPVVQVKDADGRVHPYFDIDAGTAWDGPLVVVISKFSASASEILAGAIQDYGRGLIVGDHATHGKGTVQSLTDLGREIFHMPNSPAMGALKITMQQFYRPNGDSTQKRGVLSDVELPSLTTHLDVSESDLDYPVDFDQVKRLRFPALGKVTAAIVDAIKKKSDERVAQSEDFKKLQKKIDRYMEQKERKTVTLNEKKFLAERKEVNADEEEKKKIEELADKEEGIERDYYLDEILAMTVDYVRMLKLGGSGDVAAGSN